MACLLCARQFKSLEQLKRHNNESGLHKVFFKIYCAAFPTGFDLEIEKLQGCKLERNRSGKSEGCTYKE